MMRSRQEKQRRRPASIELGQSEMLIAWQDGARSTYALQDLRRHCPCANCREQRGEPHGPQLVGGELPMATARINPTCEAKGFDPVGRYGIKIRWADGHDAGIYTFEMLRDFNPDS